VGRYEEAVAAETIAAELFHASGDRGAEGTVLGNLWVALKQLGRFEEAQQAGWQAVLAYLDDGDIQSAEVLRGWLDSSA
jgi:hypothetical protein